MMFEKDVYVKWYYDLSIQYAMFEYVKDREYMLMAVKNPANTVRHMQVINVQSLQFWKESVEKGFNSSGEYRDFFNKYYSLATYRPFPMTLKEQNAFGKGRHVAVQKHFKEDHLKYVYDYDFLIDVDIPSRDYFKMGLDDTIKIAKFLDRCSCPYSMAFSGRGFHIVIPSIFKYLCAHNIEGLKDMKSPYCLMKIYNRLLEKLSIMFTEFIDDTIADWRRVCKIPNSLALYRDSHGFYCHATFPIDDKLIDSVSFKMCSPLWQEQNAKHINRKKFVFNRDGNPVNLFRKLNLLCKYEV